MVNVACTPLPPGVLDKWHFAPAQCGQMMVLPDGCRDLIMRFSPQGEPSCMVSSLDASSYAVAYKPGDVFSGYRFRPGVRIDSQGLLNALSGLNDCAPARVQNILGDFVLLDAALSEALAAISNTAGIGKAGRALGVSERTLQRVVMQGTGQTPSFWKGLVRARRCARALLVQEQALADIAAAQGYADQAHMNREFQRWFGLTPAMFRQQPALVHAVMQPGYD